MRIHRIIEKTAAEGPGLRFCIYMQGCHNGCPGCFARETWDSNGGKEISESEIIHAIERRRSEIEGLTLLGGEPFEQAAAAAAVAEAAKALGLSVIVFTGRIYEDLLKDPDTEVQRLLGLVDMMIDGPYIREQRDLSMPWKGSSNQRYIFLTDCYDMETIDVCKNRWELRIMSNGSLCVNGMGDYARIVMSLDDICKT